MSQLTEAAFRDVHYGFRQLLRAPLFAGAAVLTLALAIGANTALFAIVNAVVLRPLPFPESDRIVSLTVAQKGDDIGRMDDPTATMAMAGGVRTFEALAAYDTIEANLTGGLQPENVSGARVAERFFDVLGVRPAIGRTFTAEETRAGGAPAPVVILSHGLSVRAFGSATDVLGRTIRLDDVSYSVVGVAPPGLRYPARAEFWLPRLPRTVPGGGTYYTDFIGRTRPGTTLATAAQDLTALREARAAELPKAAIGTEVRIMTLHERLYGGVRASLLLLWGIAGCVLLIASANLANLLLARSSARRRELALRVAIGASRARLVRQLLAESVLLSCLGALPGLALAAAGLRAFVAFGPARVTRAGGLELNADVLWFTLAMTIVTGLLFGVWPAVAAARADPQGGLKATRSTGFRTSSGHPRRTLVVLELAAAVMLTIGAALLVKSFVRFQAVDRGFDPDRVLTASLTLPRPRYVAGPLRRDFFDRVLARLRALPVVQSASVSGIAVSGMTLTMRWPAHATETAQPRTVAILEGVGARHFETYGIPLQSGRECALDAAAPEAVINAGMARHAFPNRTAVGERLDLGGQGTYTVVGVASDVRALNTNALPLPTVYGCAGRASAPAFAVIGIRVRAGTDPDSLAPAVREAVREADPTQPITAIARLSETVGRATTARWFDAGLVTVFAGVALVLAVLGLYAVIAYAVAERTHEIGVRMALGATRGDVLRLVLKQGGLLSALGVTIGCGAALALTRLVAAMLFEVDVRDPFVFVTTAMVMIAVSLTAALVPALRASGVDPLVALRTE